MSFLLILHAAHTWTLLCCSSIAALLQLCCSSVALRTAWTLTSSNITTHNTHITTHITSQITTHFTGSAALARWRHTTYNCAHITTQITTHFTNKLRAFSANTPYYYSFYDRSRIVLPVFRAHWQTGGLQSECATLPRHKRRRVGIGLAAAVIWVVRWVVIWMRHASSS
jgi:hypothetical protein